jgi:methionyl aminopeptidase
MHEDPQVLTAKTRDGIFLKERAALAIEPMVNIGRHHVTIDKMAGQRDEGWLILTHWEHTIKITEEGPIILTVGDGRPDSESSNAAVWLAKIKARL